MITPATKSASKTIAAFDGTVNTCETEVGKSVCNAPDVPPGMFAVSPRICPMIFSAAFTDGSVHLILWVDSWSYFVGPAERR